MNGYLLSMILKIDLQMYFNGLSKIFTLKWGKDNERATSSFMYISEAINKVLKNSPCMCVYVIYGSEKNIRKRIRS